MRVSIAIGFILLLFVNVQAQEPKPRPGIIPDHLKVQYAGSIGFVSIGAGYEWAKKKLNSDLFYGFVPKSAGGVDIHSLTAKLTWLPLSTVKKDCRIDWLTTGILLNYAFGRRYHLFSRTKYSFVYYGFPTAAHVAIFAGGGISRKKLGLYYEFGTTDRDVVSYVNNRKAIGFFEIINIGIGAKLMLGSK